MSKQTSKTSRSSALGGILVVLAVIAILVWATSHRSGRAHPEPMSGAIYYTGPMAQKGNPKMIADDNGRIYPPSSSSLAPAQKPVGPSHGKAGVSPD